MGISREHCQSYIALARPGLGYNLGGHSLQSPQNNLLIKKLPPRTPDRRAGRVFPPEQKCVQAIPMPSQFAWESPACIDLVVWYLFTLLYQGLTPCPL